MPLSAIRSVSEPPSASSRTVQGEARTYVEDLEDVRVRPHAAEDLDLVVQALLGLGRPVPGVLGDHLACAERARLDLLAVLDHGERASAEHLLRQLILVLQTAFADELQLDA
eukprot:scaffold4820_cov67-Phaeocystis_antarctica.AAC.2